MLPTVETVDQALQDLAMTDEKHALLFARKDAAKLTINLQRAVAYLEANGSIAERNAIAETTDLVVQSIKDWENAVADFKLVENKRSLANLKIDVWRSLNKQGRTL